MTIKLDDDVPVPVSGQQSAKYPLANMKVGQSFFVAGKTSSGLTTICRSYCNYHKLPWKFKARKIEEDGVSGARIWRVE